MTICYAGKSAISAQAIADVSDDILTVRNGDGDINWGRSRANTRLNPDISNSTNKRVMRELFAEKEVPMPKLLTLEEVRFALVDGKTVVGRPDHHSKGRGFWLIKRDIDLMKALRGTKKKMPATHFMEYIEAEHEVRVHIFKGRSIRISEKAFFIDENGKRDYTTAKPTEVRKVRIRKAAKKAVKAVGLDFGAVDILVRNEYEEKDGESVVVQRPYVLEVNAAPGLGGSMPRLYANVFAKWYEKESKNGVR